MRNSTLLIIVYRIKHLFNVFRITNNNSEQYEVSNYSYEDDDDYDDEWSDDSEWSDDDDQNKTVSLCCFYQ